MRQSLLFVLTLTLVGGAATEAQLQEPSGPWHTYDTSNGEWRSYAGDIKGTKYSRWTRSTRVTSRTWRSRGRGRRSTTS